MSFLLGVVIFIVAVLISVTLHELGHFLTAKKFGMKVTQFFIGFGNTLWSTRRGETEYGVKSLPFGAVVRITGMTTFDEVAPEDEPLIFQRASPLGALSFAGSAFGPVLTGSADPVAKLPAALPDLFAKNRSKTPAGNVSSVVGVANIAGQAVAAGGGWQVVVADLLLIIISLNIFIGAFNLLPLLPLDGGHPSVIVYEQVKASVAPLPGRPDPGLADPQP